MNSSRLKKSVFPLGTLVGTDFSKIILILLTAMGLAAPAFARTSQNFQQTFPLSSGGASRWRM